MTRLSSGLSRIPLHPLLIAAYAVLYLYSVNLDEVLPVDAAMPLVRSILAAAVLMGLLALLFRDLRRGAIVATSIVVAFFAFGHVAGALTGAGLGDRELLAAWGLVVIVATVYAIRARGSLPQVTTGLNVLAIVLIAVVAVGIVPYEVQRAGRGPVELTATVSAAGGAEHQPDIYFLIFDRYGSADSIERRFGIDDNDLYGWLRDEGFQVPANSHANYRATDFSLAATLNMRFLDNLTEEIGPESGDRTPARDMIRDHAVGRFLKDRGYTYYQLGSWFGPTRSIQIADVNLVPGITSEFESVLNDTTVVPAIERVVGSAPSTESTFRDRHHDGTVFELRQLRRVATAPGPKFVFGHILLPHDPYVFRADGSPISEAEAKAGKEADLYAGQLAFANAQIKEIVGYLLSGPEASRPVVIIEGDEGPLACRSIDCVGTSPDYLRIRLGNLVAMYMPGVDYELPDTFTSVNTFRTVFREYFGADLPPMPDRSFTWPDNDHIYDFQDVTDKLVDSGSGSSP